MTIVARVHKGDQYRSALTKAKQIARREAEKVPVELPGFEGSVAFLHPRVRLYRAKDGAYVVERKP